MKYKNVLLCILIVICLSRSAWSNELSDWLDSIQRRISESAKDSQVVPEQERERLLSELGDRLPSMPDGPDKARGYYYAHMLSRHARNRAQARQYASRALSIEGIEPYYEFMAGTYMTVPSPSAPGYDLARAAVNKELAESMFETDYLNTLDRSVYLRDPKHHVLIIYSDTTRRLARGLHEQGQVKESVQVLLDSAENIFTVAQYIDDIENRTDIVRDSSRHWGNAFQRLSEANLKDGINESLEKAIATIGNSEANDELAEMTVFQIKCLGAIYQQSHLPKQELITMFENNKDKPWFGTAVSGLASSLDLLNRYSVLEILLSDYRASLAEYESDLVSSAGYTALTLELYSAAILYFEKYLELAPDSVWARPVAGTLAELKSMPELDELSVLENEIGDSPAPTPLADAETPSSEPEPGHDQAAGQTDDNTSEQRAQESTNADPRYNYAYLILIPLALAGLALVLLPSIRKSTKK